MLCSVHVCFCRLLAFLREEEERERLEEIERLRPIGTAVGPFMEYRYCFDHRSYFIWKYRVHTKEPHLAACSRHRHACC